MAIASLTSLSLHLNNFSGPLPRSLATLPLLQHLSCDMLPASFAAEQDGEAGDLCKMRDYITAHAADDEQRGHSDPGDDEYNTNIVEEQDNLLTALEEFGGQAEALQWERFVPRRGGQSQVPERWEGVSFDKQGCARSLVLSAQGWDRGEQGSLSFPSSIEFLSNLVFLDLSRNGLRGGVPAEVCRLAHLQCLYLHDNQLVGRVPPSLGELLSLRTLHLAGNQLTGPLPSELSALQDLAVLNMSSNRLEGRCG